MSDYINVHWPQTRVNKQIRDKAVYKYIAQSLSVPTIAKHLLITEKSVCRYIHAYFASNDTLSDFEKLSTHRRKMKLENYLHST